MSDAATEAASEAVSEALMAAPALISAVAAGLLLGAFFFGGLWWTVRKGLTARQPALLFSASLLLRGTVAVAGFYLLGDGHWQRLLAGLLGFFMARLLITRFAGPPAEPRDAAAKEAGHAP
ncbi:N-ATPase subunit AtpR [Endothiovibrio diazotrophicus]